MKKSGISLILLTSLFTISCACSQQPSKPTPTDKATFVARPQGLETLVYSSSYQDLATAGISEEGTILYSLTTNLVDFKSTIPQAKDVGTYNVYYYIKGDASHLDSDIEFVNAAISMKNPVFSGLEIQNAVKTGEPLYPVAPTVDTDQIVNLALIKDLNGNTVESAINTGTYVFTYNVIENNNCYGGEFTVVFNITDTPVPTIIKVPRVKSNLVFTGEEMELIYPGEVRNGTYLYKLDNGEFSPNIPKATTEGKYTITYYAKGTDGFNDTEPETVIATIYKQTKVTPVAIIDFCAYSQAQYSNIFDFTGQKDIEIMDMTVEKTDEGCKMTATKNSIDPHTPIHLERCFKHLGYQEKEGTYIPFTADSVKSFAIKYKATVSNTFQTYYAVGSQTQFAEAFSVSANYSANDEFGYIAFDLSQKSNWSGVIHDIFRLDFSKNAKTGDVFIAQEIEFFTEGGDAAEYAKENTPSPDTSAFSLDLTKFSDEEIKSIFSEGTTSASKAGDGAMFNAKSNTSDPYIVGHLEKAFKIAGYELGNKVANSYIPFTADEIKSVAVSIKFQYSDEMQLFYTCGTQTAISEAYSIKKPFGKATSYELISFELSNANWSGKVNDMMRFDFGRSMYINEPFYISGIYFFNSVKGANEFAIKVNPGDRSYLRDERHYEKLPKKEAGYYVCLFEESLGGLLNDVRYDTKEAALAAITSNALNAVNGYRVANEKGEFVAGPNGYTKLQCDLLREGRWTRDYIVNNKFNYNNAPINPAINDRAKMFSCDRTVCWILYRCGFIDQPYQSGICINWNTGMGNLRTWCLNHGFIDVSSEGYTNIQAGDVIEVKYDGRGTADPVDHTFMAASNANGGNLGYRYDGGSNWLIQNSPLWQNFSISGDTAIGRVVYILRPQVTATNNVFASEYLK